MKTFTKITSIFLLTLGLSVQLAQAQSDTASSAQNVYVELLGPGITFSGNYDSRFSKRQDGLGGRVGIGYASDSDFSIFSIPLQVNYLLGNKGKYFEMGLGATYVNFSGSDTYAFLGESSTYFYTDNSSRRYRESTVLGTTTFGYRSQPVNGGFNFRGSINPVFNSNGFYPFFFGVSFGYTFKNK